MNLPYFSNNNNNLPQFIERWSGVYHDRNEPLYEQNIGLLTKDAIVKLFIWKNGTLLSKNKSTSVRNNYISRVEYLMALNKDMSPKQLLSKEFSGGMIWRIFLLHIWQPKEYPIFDQHVYRAMAYIKTGEIIELKDNDREKMSKYLEEYIPFYRSLGTFPDRKLDKALWMFGKFIKSGWHKLLPTSGLYS